VKNGETGYHVIRKWLGRIRKKSEILERCIQYWNVKTLVVAFAMFVNADRHVVKINPGIEIISMFNKLQNCYKCDKLFINSRKFFLSHRMPMLVHHVNGHYHETELNENDTTEHLGYFSPTTKLYRIDPVLISHELVSFSNL